MSNRPRPLSDLMPGLTRDILGKRSLLFGKMALKWPHIVGEDIAAKATPIDLKFAKKAKEKSQATLVLGVSGAYALELSYQKTLLIERLNMFFGYPAIKDIKLVQNNSLMDKKNPASPPIRPITLQEQQQIDGLVGSIQENDLQTALKNLGKAIVSRKSKT